MEREHATAAAWDMRSQVAAIICDDSLVMYDESQDREWTKPLPGVGLDVTHWGDGFGVIVKHDDVVELYRTPPTSVEQFGLLGELPDGVVAGVGGIDLEAPVVLTKSGDVLSVELDGNSERLLTGVSAIAEAPSLEAIT